MYPRHVLQKRLGSFSYFLPQLITYITFALLHLLSSTDIDNDKVQSPKDAGPRHCG
jgi:hypothetical protein